MKKDDDLEKLLLNANPQRLQRVQELLEWRYSQGNTKEMGEIKMALRAFEKRKFDDPLIDKYINTLDLIPIFFPNL